MTGQTIDGVPREQMACMPVERSYDVRAKMIIAFNEAKKAGGDLDDALDAAYKSALRYSPNPLSYEQPAPVAVVMPGRLQEILTFLDGSGTLDGWSFGSDHSSGRKYWWRNELRACLDELKRPAHANPQPGTEPSGTHIDNDGLDEWRKP